MGATHSTKRADTSKFGQVYLHTDKSTNHGGETITGNIYLNIIFGFPGNRLLMRLTGKETVHLVVEERRTRTVYRYNSTTQQDEPEEEVYYVDVHYSETNHFLSSVVTAHTFQSEISPGQYTIPFAFRLPTGLPSSFYQEGYRHLARIHYSLEAFIPSNYQKNVKMSYKQPLIVREVFHKEAQQYARQVSKNISGCCSGEGVATLSAGFAKDAYIPGEVAQTVVELDLTQCKEEFGPLSIALIHHLRAKADGQKEFVSKTVKAAMLNGVRKGTTTGKKHVALALPKGSQVDTYRRAKAYGMKSYLLGLKNRSAFLNMTTKSQLIQSWYELSVSCQTEECCCATQMEISCPVHIYSQEVQFAPIEAPEGWSPTKIESINISFAPQLPQMESTAPVSIESNTAMVSHTDIVGGYDNTQTIPQYNQNITIDYPGNESNYQPPMQYGPGYYENTQKEYAKLEPAKL